MAAVVVASVLVAGCSGGEQSDGTAQETTTTLPAGQVVGNFAVVGGVEVSLLGESIEVRTVGQPARTVVLDEKARDQVAAAVRAVADAQAASPIGTGADCQAGELRSLTATVDNTPVIVPPVGGVGVCTDVWDALGLLGLVLAQVAEPGV